VDSKHDAWLNIWMTDAILRYDPAAKQWTRFDLPTRGTEARYISVTEHTGALQVVVPYSRTSKVAVMSFRSEQDLAALKAQAGKGAPRRPRAGRAPPPRVPRFPKGSGGGGGRGPAPP